jgi:ariadne-1
MKTIEKYLLLLGPWKDHASRQCNVYHEDEGSKNQVSAREALGRYMHYFTRYQVHSQSLELENKLSNQVDQRIHEMQAEAMSFTEQQAIYKAFAVLQQCRRTLKYTYGFAYYLYRNNQAEVFEENQADLERATEALSGFLEQEIDPEQKQSSLNLMDRTHYCGQRRKILLDHCKEGYSEHYWAGLDSY